MALNYDTELYMAGMIHQGAGYNPSSAAARAQKTLVGWPNIIADCEVYGIPVSFNICGFEAVFGDAGRGEVSEIDVFHPWHADSYWATHTWYSDMPQEGGNYLTVGDLSGYTRSYSLIYGGPLTERALNSHVPFEISYHNFGHESLSNIDAAIMDATFRLGVAYHKRIGSKLTAECPPWNNNPQSSKYPIYVANGIYVFNRMEGSMGVPYEVIDNLWIVPRNDAFHAGTNLTASIDSAIANGHVLAPYSHPEDGFDGANRTGFQTSLAYARAKVDQGQLWATTLSEIGRYWEAKSDVSTSTRFVDGKTVIDIDLNGYDALRFGIPYLTFMSPMPDSSPFAVISVNYPEFHSLNSESDTVRVADGIVIYTIYLDPYNTTTVQIEGGIAPFSDGVDINLPVLTVDSIAPTQIDSGIPVSIQATTVSTDAIYSVNLIYQCNSAAKDSRILDFNPLGYWETQIGPFAAGDTISYYVSVTDNSGRREVSSDKNFSIALGPDTVDPQWHNQGQSTDTPPAGSSLQLYAHGMDERALRYATLATDETGVWEKKTSAYGSPMSLGDLQDTWTVSSFTWSNPSIPWGTTVSWRIYYEDSAGNETATDIMSFILQEPDTEYPNYFDPLHSLELFDTPTELSLRWTDNVALDEYIFSFDNGTGTFVDDPAVKFTPKDGWWNQDWLYRREISVDNTAGSETLTDHTVLISVDTATLIANNKLNPYAGDIRFVDTNGPTKLDFWLESGLDTADTRIWVKIPEVATGAVHTIYMYYGSANHRVLQSDGMDTFAVFDDFGGRGWEEYKYSGNPVMGPGSIAGGSGVFSSVLRESETLWRMYASYDSDSRDIGLSNSTDGVNWTHQGVVLRKGASGEWDSANIWCPAIWKENGTYYMFYAASGPGGIAMGLATSPDGVTFTKHPNNPLFEDPDWAAGNTEGPCLSMLKENGVYSITYNTLNGHRRLSFASSTDLINWTRVYDYPRFIENKTTEWNYNTFCGNVFKYDDLFYLLIPGQDSSRDYAKFGMYVSSSPVFPEDDTEFKGIIMIGEPGTWEGTDMDTPWVVQFDDRIYMYYSACGSCWSQTGMTLINDVPFALTQAYPPGNYINANRAATVSQQIMPPVGWEKSIIGYDEVAGQNFEITLDPAISGRAVVMQDSNDSVPLELYRDFSSLSSGSVSAWVRTNTFTGDYDLDLYGDAQTVTALSVGFDSNGNFHYWNGSYVDTAIAYATDTWYRIQVDFDVATDKYTFAVYDMSFAELLRVENIDFGVAVTAGIDSIHFHTSASFNGSAYLDDVRITTLADTEPVVSMSSELTPDLTESWSIVTKTLTSDLGATIRWKVTASDTSGNTTTSNIYSFTTSAPDLPPAITLDSPDDNFWSDSNSVTFTATCTDGSDITSVSLYGDWGGSWTLIDTNTDPNLNGQPVSFTETLPEGNWTWAIECTDNIGQTTASSRRTIHVDTTPQSWWHGHYGYRKRLIVTENAGRDLFAYPVCLILDTASPISSAKMKPGCEDVRVIYNGVEIPSQVIEPNSEQTQIWFQIDLFASQADYEVYLYYGNPAAQSPDYSSQCSIHWDSVGFSMNTGKITAVFNPAGGIIGQVRHNMNGRNLMAAKTERGLGYLFSENPVVHYIFRADETDDTIVLTEDGPIVKIITAYSGESPQWIQQNIFYNNQEFVDFKVLRPSGASTEKFLTGANNISPDGVFSASDSDELLRVGNSATDIAVVFDNSWKYNPVNGPGYVGLTDPTFTNQLAFFWDSSYVSAFTWKPRTTTDEVGAYSLFIGGNGVTGVYGTINADVFDYRFMLSYSQTPNNADTQAFHEVSITHFPTVSDGAEEIAGPDQTPPAITILSPVEMVYTANYVILDYTLSEVVSECSYSLDEAPSVIIPAGQSITLSGLANGVHRLVVYATDFAGNTGSAAVSFTTEAVIVPKTWWHADWSYRVLVSVETGEYLRTNEPVEHGVDFTALFAELEPGGALLDINSVRVVEHDADGSIIGEVISQFDPAADYHPATHAVGTVVWIMEGTTPADSARDYYIYFDATDKAKATPDYVTDVHWNAASKALSNTHLNATVGSAGTRSGIASLKYDGIEYLTNQGMVYIDGAPAAYEVMVNGPVKKTIKLTAAANGNIEVTLYDRAEFIKVQGHITGSNWSFTPFPYVWSLNPVTCTTTLNYYDGGVLRTETVGSQSWLGHAPQEGWACYTGAGTNKDFCLVTDSSTLSMSNNFWRHNSQGLQLMMPGLNPKTAFPIDPASWIVLTDTYQDGRDFWSKLSSPVSISQGSAENLAGMVTYTVSVFAGPNGEIAPNQALTIHSGDSQAFTATPNVGYEVDVWLLDEAPVQTGSTEYTLPDIQADHTVRVTFKPVFFTITGHILNPVGSPLPMVTVTADNGGSLNTTDENGYYQLKVGYDWTGTVTPAKQDYVFGPNSITYSNVLTDQTDDYSARHIADLAADGVIDEADVQILAANWLADISPDVDIVVDGKMNLADFAILAEHWLKER